MGSGTRLAEREVRFHREQRGERTNRFTNALCTSLKTQEENETANLLGDAMARRVFLWPRRYVSICIEARGNQHRHPLNLFTMKAKNYLCISIPLFS